MCLGARIGAGSFIDSTDLADFDLLSIGKGVAVGEGVTISGHSISGGFVVFKDVSLCPKLNIMSSKVLSKVHNIYSVWMLIGHCFRVVMKYNLSN